MICNHLAIVDWISIVATALAAVFWLLAALVRFPRLRLVWDDNGEGNTPLGQANRALKRQAVLNSFGAAAACIAALTTVLSKLCLTI